VAHVVEVPLQVRVHERVAFLDRKRLARELGYEDGSGVSRSVGGTDLGRLRLVAHETSAPRSRAGSRKARQPSPSSGIFASSDSNARSVGPAPATHTGTPAAWSSWNSAPTVG